MTLTQARDGRTITRLLVANRGEIARRVFATCRRLGIGTVAVHSDADADLPFVREADVAVRLPGDAAAETYLRGDLLVAAAQRAGADAVHPGYGFLSESADFARQVTGAGLTWVGPSPESIEVMGSKLAAKELVAGAGVPVLAAVDPSEAHEGDLPLLVKASAGGGGRGMRVVRSLVELPAAVAQASAEAAATFGDGTVFVEPYVEHARHVEVQVFGDPAAEPGRIRVLGARDCSVQRRHQKLLEEAPAPGLPREVEQALFEAARAAAGAVDYVGAGTVELLLDPATGRFFFLEMNTRLQVEHPVTESVHPGLDLVALQLAAAAEPRFVRPDSGPRSARGSDESGVGHAVEARIYAEDPAHEWAPQSGRLTRFAFPGVSSELGPLAGYGVRVDAGYAAGDEVSTHYDAMLAKVIAWAPTRAEAARRLAATLARAQIHGVRTNRDLLVRVLRHEAFLAGEVSTDFLDRHDLVSAGSPADAHAVRLSAFAAAVALAERAQAGSPVQQGIPAGWRNVVSQPHLTRFVRTSPAGRTRDWADESGLEVRWYGGRGGYAAADLDVTVIGVEPARLPGGAARVVLAEGRLERGFAVHVTGDAVDVESSLGHVALTRVPRFTDPAARVAAGSLLAPMPGTVTAVGVAAGDRVRAGDPVLTLEAMKMQHPVAAPHDGVVTDVPVAAGDRVAAGAVLAVVSTDSTSGEGPTSDEGDSA